MARGKLNSKLLYRYIVSYSIVLLLPVLIIGLVAYNFFIHLLEREVTKSNMNALTQVRDAVDVNMTELNNIAFHIAGNTNLTPYNVTKSPFAELNTIAQLRNYVSANQFIDQLLLYFHGHDTLYTPYSTYDVHTFTDKIVGYDKWSPPSFVRDLQTATYPYMRGAEDVTSFSGIRERIVTYVMPLPPNHPTPYGTVVFQLKESAFQSLLEKKFGDDPGDTFILNEKNELIVSTHGFPAEDAKRLAEAGYGEPAADQAKTVRLHDRDYFVYDVRSERLGWTYVSLVDQEAVLHNVKLAQRRTLYAISVVFVLGGVLIFFATQLSYKPIRRLQRFAESKAKREFDGLGEIESIQSALSLMSDSNEELNRNISSSRPAMKHYTLLTLLRGRLPEQAELNRRLELAHMQLTKPYHLVAVLQFPRSFAVQPSARSTLLDDLEASFLEGAEAYGMESVEGASLIFILGTDDPGGVEHKRLLIDAHRTLSDKWQTGLTIGAGTAYGSWSELGKSYIEACGAADYRLIAGYGQVLFFSDIVPKTELPHEDYSKGDWNQLRLYMYQGDAGRIEQYLEAMIGTIRERQLPLFLVKCMCFDLIHVILSMLSELRWADGELAEQYPDVWSLSEFETVEELIALVKHISEDICRIVAERKESGNTDLAGKMMAYLSEHYGSSQLSLQQVADEFGMSASYLSRYFKDQTGQTVSQYIQTLRMEKAKELLRAGADSLQEVVERIGYGSVSGFIRKFKESEGVTPGEFRTMHQK
ncbi:MAG: AraC family transcriptional regulator [Paenibacillus sp.]|nr:AraC family transcriptional regulator [Paenibacillus sp.]